MTATALGNVRSVAWIAVLGVGMAAAAVAALLPADSPLVSAITVGAQVVALVAIVWRFRSTPPRPAPPWIVFFVGVGLSAVADAATAELAAVEPVAAPVRLLAHRREVGVEARHRLAGVAEPLELRVVTVALRGAPQHLAGQ